MGKGKSCHEKFDFVSEDLRRRLNMLCLQHLTATKTSSPEIAQRLRSWEEHFDCAIKGAQTLGALKELQQMRIPNQRFADKLAQRIQALERSAAKAQRQNAAKTTIAVQTATA